MKRFERTRIWLSENGVLWTLMYQARLTLGRLAERLDRQLRRREEQYGLPGTNPVKLNLRKWETYDWSKAGRAGNSRKNAMEPPKLRKDMDA